MAKFKASVSLGMTAAVEWVRDRCSGLAAAMAFNLILATAPFIGIILWLSDWLLGRDRTREYIFPVVFAWLGPRGEGLVRFLLKQSAQVEPREIFALGVLGIFSLFFGAVGFFLQMQDALQTIWDVRRETPGLIVQLKKRQAGLGYVLGSALLAFGGIAAGAVVLSISRSSKVHWIALAIRWGGGAVIAYLTFWAAMAFWLKFLPPVRLPWRRVLPWAALTAMLHLFGREIFAIISRKDSSTSLAESLVMLLLWFYYASAVFLYGAEVMRICCRRSGNRAVLP